ncbi:lysophospholipid acyltransferase family protein [Pseudonocardia acaciae]|uniref:lysophospholipid acyltransferase family protein n=1 Tax=Pseudonocardia acaciae TaxID=551276 RepID=UPI0007E8EB3C|nr:lysophospholipid acyltransferase family protein [Pseudonocardia acaciae]
MSGHAVLPPVALRAGHSWAPASPCGPECLPADGELPRVGRIRVAVRLAAVATLVLGTGLAAVVLPFLGVRRRANVLRVMFRAALRAAGVRLVVSGSERLSDGAGGGGVLVVANHLSWLDVLALGAVQPMRMVAKREIKDWPAIGALAARVGTLFVDRAGLRELPSVVAQTAAALREGSLVGLFPEGTTWCGAASGVFRRAGFQAALDAGVPVRPVAQRMRLPGGEPTTAGAFIGDDTLLDSMLRVMRLPGLVLEVEVLPPLAADGVDRRELARRAELAIAAATGVPAPAAKTPAPKTPATKTPAARVAAAA